METKMDNSTNRKPMNILEFTNSQPRLLDSDNAFAKLGLEDDDQNHNNNAKNINIGIGVRIPINRGKDASPCNSANNTILFGSPTSGFMPTTKRTRTNSTYERAMDNPIERGRIKYFCRTKGHGMIESEKGGEEIFVHISDIEDDFCPIAGDVVTYKICFIPPKYEKYQAIHVNIQNYTNDVHVRWDSPIGNNELRSCDEIPNNLVT